MAGHWPDVQRVFEALSYIVKPMSPTGTELFYTIAYDTYRRKDTADLCTTLSKKSLAGETNIAYRLSLQIQSYRATLIAAAAKPKSKASAVRPISFYILTNGAWTADKEADPKPALEDIVQLVKRLGLPRNQVAVRFISFAQNAAAVQRMNDLAKTDFGL